MGERGESENVWNASWTPSTFCSPVESPFLRFLNVGVGRPTRTRRGGTPRPNSTFESRTTGRRKNAENKMSKSNGHLELIGDRESVFVSQSQSPSERIKSRNDTPGF